MTNPLSQVTANQSPFLRTTRTFPEDSQPLSVEINKAYLDIAAYVNRRTIGIYPANKPQTTGDSWLITSQNQSSQRQVYSFAGAGNIAHRLNWNSVSFISPKSYGTYTDGSNWYGAIYAGSTSIGGQISFYVTNTNIVVVVDGGAPSITSGYIVLEYVSQP